MPDISCGKALISVGIALRNAVIRLSVRLNTASSINGAFAIIDSAICISTSTINGMSVGNISDTSEISVDTSSITASII